jgi:hypothetical protein
MLLNQIIDKLLTKLYIDWTNMAETYANFVQVMFITDSYLGRSFPYFMMSYGEERETLWVLRDFIL